MQVEVTIEPEQMAVEFWEMDSTQQARFFTALIEQEAGTKNFIKQMTFVKEQLSGKSLAALGEAFA